MINAQPYSIDAPSILITATETATAAVALPGSGNTVRVVNTGTKTAYVAATSAGIAAVVPSGTASRFATAILAGSDVTFGRSLGATLISAIVATGDTSTTLVVSSGEGF